MTKQEIAETLEEIATLVELKGENPFKVRAYQAGARVVESMEESELARAVAAGELEKVKGIGQALAEKITELHTTGRLEFYEKLQASIEPGLREILEIPGLGPKKIRALHDRLGITGIAELTAACASGAVAELDGFGEKTQEKILAGSRTGRPITGATSGWTPGEVAEPGGRACGRCPQVRQAEAAGSLRRKLETVGRPRFYRGGRDKSAPVMEWFVGRPEVRR